MQLRIAVLCWFSCLFFDRFLPDFSGSSPATDTKIEPQLIQKHALISLLLSEQYR